MYKLAQFLSQSGSDSADQVKKQEFLWSPLDFHDASEHPDGEHIEEYVLESLMKEHIGNQLPYPETRSKEEMQSEQFVEVYSVFGKCHRTHPTENVYDEQIFGYGR